MQTTETEIQLPKCTISLFIVSIPYYHFHQVFLNYKIKKISVNNTPSHKGMFKHLKKCIHNNQVICSSSVILVQDSCGLIKHFCQFSPKRNSFKLCLVIFLQIFFLFCHLPASPCYLKNYFWDFYIFFQVNNISVSSFIKSAFTECDIKLPNSQYHYEESTLSQYEEAQSYYTQGIWVAQ